MNFRDEIINAIETIVKKEIGKVSKNRYIPSVVTEISGDKYKVKIDNANYWVKNGVDLTGLKVGTLVLVHVYDNNLNHAYICAKR